MKPLFIFETPEKAKSSTGILLDRISETLIPLLEGLSFKCEIHTIPELGATPLLNIRKGTKNILVIPWIRPYSNNKTLSRTLNDYPRLNILSKYKKETDENKINKMQGITKSYKLHFLVMLIKQDENDLFWFDSYQNIPSQYWKTTYREKGKPKDRIHFPDYKDHTFIKKLELKNKLLKYIKNENQ